MASKGLDGGAPTFDEHVSICRFGPESVYAKFPKEFAELIANQQALESLEGVLDVHCNDIPRSERFGDRAYVHHFRTADKASRQRVLLGAHQNNARFLLEVSQEAQDTHEHIVKSLQESKTTGVHEHHSHHKLSSHRLNTDFRHMYHVDWEAQPVGSHAAKFSVIRVGCRKAKEGTPASLIDKYIDEVRGLPSHFPLLQQVTVGRNIAEKFAVSNHYPETGMCDRDVAFFFGYANAHHRDELDSKPEFIAFHKKWTDLLGGDYEFSDLTADRSGR